MLRQKFTKDKLRDKAGTIPKLVSKIVIPVVCGKQSLAVHSFKRNSKDHLTWAIQKKKIPLA